jgi:hypothetical protein
MKQILNLTVLRKFFILGVMLAGLAFVSTSNLRATAPCCEDCEAYLSDCLAGCNGNQACETACYQQSNGCFRHCVFCG